MKTGFDGKINLWLAVRVLDHKLVLKLFRSLTAAKAIAQSGSIARTSLKRERSQKQGPLPSASATAGSEEAMALYHVKHGPETCSLAGSARCRTVRSCRKHRHLLVRMVPGVL